MIGQVENEEALKKLVANGLIPSIEREIKEYKESEAPYLYSMAFSIGELVDAYHKLFMTGNSCEIVKNKGRSNK